MVGSDHVALAVYAFADAVNQTISVIVAACRCIYVNPGRCSKYLEVLEFVLHGVGSVHLA
jgi:hypothetical protein